MKTYTSNDLLEPLKFYNNELKDQFHRNAEDFFDSLAKESNIDINKNRELTNKYLTTCDKIKSQKNKMSKQKTKKGFAIFFIILLFLATFVFFYFALQNLNSFRWLWILIGVLTLALAITMIVYVCKKLNKVINRLQKIIDSLTSEANSYYNECLNILGPLFSLFDFNIPAHLINKTIPLIQMDDSFDPSSYQYMHDKYGFGENLDPNRSTVGVQSGSILGNPFIIVKDYVTYMYNETYTGYLTITYTERVYNGKNWETVTRSQTLTATYTHPKPGYYYDTYLVYGCDAAPNLSFSRKPTVSSCWNEKEIKKRTRAFDKKLDKKVSEGIKNNTGFTKLQNSEFEMCFNALDRDNELEFRLLFTPLAQLNLLSLLQSKTPYGDDFSFTKKRCLNYIKSNHSQGEYTYETNPEVFFDYSYDGSKKKFLNFVDEYLKIFYFDLAPLLSIPLYQQTKTREYIYNNDYRGNVTSYETESTVNYFNPNLFRPNETSTGIILKNEFYFRKGQSDVSYIHSYSYKANPKVIYISVYGNDGHYHDVPVNYIDYELRDKRTPVQIQRLNISRNDFLKGSSQDNFTNYFQGNRNNGILFRKRFFSSILMDDSSIYDDQILNDIFTKKE